MPGLSPLRRPIRWAFAPLYARYFDPVYRYCYRRLGHPEAAADAAAQVFTKALAALPATERMRHRSGPGCSPLPIT